MFNSAVCWVPDVAEGAGCLQVVRTEAVDVARIASQGLEAAKKAALEFLEGFKQPVSADDREMLRMVARTSLRTKLAEPLADKLTDIVTDAVLAVRKPDEPIDLFMVCVCVCAAGVHVQVLPVHSISKLHSYHAIAGVAETAPLGVEQLDAF
jgi:hypothetical protein